MGSKLTLLMLLPLFSAIAVLGASNSTASYNSTYKIAVNLSAELNNSNAQGFNLPQGYFSSQSASDCVRVLITSCDNNVPNQFVCINNAYYSAYANQSQNISASRQQQACPQFILEGTVACGVQAGYCVVTSSSSTFTINSTTTLNVTTTMNNTGIPAIPLNSTITTHVENFFDGVVNSIVAFLKSIFHLS